MSAIAGRVIQIAELVRADTSRRRIEIGSMHVGDLDGTGDWFASGAWTARVTIAVHDGSDAPVGGATVSGYWGNSTKVVKCTTGTAGTCTLSSVKLASTQTQIKFTVAGVSGALLYDPTLNHDPDGDSDGTIITIARPIAR